MNDTTKTIVRIAVLPGIIPRIRHLFGTGFGFFAAVIAQVFYMVRLLPMNHPYLNPSNKGRFGVRHVIFEARRNLIFSRENSDQVIIFFTIVSGIILLLGQFALFAFSLLTQSAFAAGLGGYFTSFFVTAAPADDIAFMTLDRVFGIPNMFNSKVNGGFDGPFPTPFHTGLHTILEFYSTGVFIVGIILIIYFTMTIIGETAASGTPFGRRFNPWFGLRFILAIAFLAPIYLGLNMGQLMTLRMAKWGSSVATNGWIYFNNALLGETLAGNPNDLVATPNEPDISVLMEFMFVVRACVIGQDKMYNRQIDAYILHDAVSNPTPPPATVSATPFSGTTFIDALNLTDNNNITIRFGEEDAAAYPTEEGNVRPFCGQLVFNVNDVETDGGLALQQAYYQMVDDLWNEGLYIYYANNMALRMLPTIDQDPSAIIPTDGAFYSAIRSTYAAQIQTAIVNAVAAEQADTDWADQFMDRGWAGAAIWYNKIAELNGGLIASARNLPNPSLYPEVMEQVRERRQENDDNMEPMMRFRPVLSGGDTVDFDMEEDYYLATYLYAAQAGWFERYEQDVTGNILVDIVNLLFGTSGLFDMTDPANANVHPLAQIVGVGRGLIESSITNLGFAFAGHLAGGLTNILGDFVGALGTAVGGFTSKLAMIGFTLGFILFYVVPFLPFIYFFFAFGGWIKSIFEAIVGVPLWTLSLIRIDGEGPPGPNGMDGLYLVFEIFLRPILIIFGFIAAISIFAALVRTLHEIWYLVVSNLTGHGDLKSATKAGTGSIAFYRHPIDQLFYTILYAVIVYLIGTSCFKLIDGIPNQMLRWMGQSVSTFQENAGDPAENVVRNLYAGMATMTGQAKGAMGGLMMRNG